MGFWMSLKNNNNNGGIQAKELSAATVYFLKSLNLGMRNVKKAASIRHEPILFFKGNIFLPFEDDQLRLILKSVPTTTFQVQLALCISI